MSERREPGVPASGERGRSGQTAKPPRAANGSAPAVVTRGTVVIDVEACKGCDLCIDACPPRVLVMTEHAVNTRGYRYPLLLPGCTGCRACAQICPDFVFQVYKYDTPLELDVAMAGGKA